jgi:hypothetical protein
VRFTLILSNFFYMDVAAMARCVGRCYVSPAFGESESHRLSERRFLKLSSSTNSDPAGSKSLKLRGKIHRRMSYFRPIMAKDESISSRSGNNHVIPFWFISNPSLGSYDSFLTFGFLRPEISIVLA